MKKLYRSRKDSKLFGLCGGLADMLNVDATLLRVVLLVTTFFTGGTTIPIYFIACLIIPKEPVDPFYNLYGNSNPDMNPYMSGRGRDPYFRPPHDPRQHPPAPGGFPNRYGGRGSAYGPEYRPPAEPPRPNPPMTPPPVSKPKPAQHEASLDEMMRELEKKAMEKEIEELRAKLADYEKNGNKGDK